MNLVSAILFAAFALVRWDYAVAMAFAAIIGGYVGARLSLRKLQPIYVRWIVIAIGFGLAAYLLRPWVLSVEK